MKQIFMIAALVAAPLCISLSSCSSDSSSSDDGGSVPSITPVVTGFAPAQAQYGDTLTISGENFSPVLSENKVTLDGISTEVVSATATQIQVIVPKNLNCSGSLLVNVNGLSASAPSTFTYIPTATVTTIAGSTAGYANGSGTAAKFNQPYAITIDALGNLYVADFGNFVIRKITPAGVVTTFAGNGTQGNTDDATGVVGQFWWLWGGITIDASGNLYVTDANRIRKVSSSGKITTFAGSGAYAYADGNGTAAAFNAPVDITIDASNNLYVADSENDRIRKITPSGAVSTLAGSTRGYLDAVGTAAHFDIPEGITLGKDGNLYVADTYNNFIRKITLPDARVSTYVGSNSSGLSQFRYPERVTMDKSGNLYVTSNASLICKVTPEGVVTTLAGSSTQGYADGTGTAARFNDPYGMAIDASGNLYVADTGNNRIRKITFE